MPWIEPDGQLTVQYAVCLGSNDKANQVDQAEETESELVEAVG